VQDMHLRLGVIKASPNRECYMWHAIICVLDSNCRCLNLEIMHSAFDPLFEMASINVESKDSVLLKESVIRSHHGFKIWEKSLSAVALPCLGFAFTTTIDGSAGLWGTRSSHFLDLRSCCFLHYVSWLYAIDAYMRHTTSACDVTSGYVCPWDLGSVPPERVGQGEVGGLQHWTQVTWLLRA